MTDTPLIAVHNDRRGVSLLMTMLLTLLLLVAITGATMRTSAERRSAMDGAATVEAFAVAQSGLERYLDGLTTPPSVLPDSQTFNLPVGRAVVTLRRFRAAVGDTLLVATSRGELTTSQRYDPTAAVATRTVAQLIRFRTGDLDIPGAFTALSGFSKNGNSGSLSGVDACTTGGAPLPSIPGMAVPSTSAASPTSPAYSGPTGPINGDPDNTPVILGTPGASGTAKDAVDIDWAGIVDRTSITPDFYRKNTSPASGSFPTTAQIGGSNWPITFVEGNLTLNNSNVPSGGGQGILVVTGNLTMNGNSRWNGVLLVGGVLTSNGNNTVYGATFSGLNVKLGQTVPTQALGNGTKTYQYHSCHIASAMGRFGGWQRLGNGWLDNWPSY
jgi:hypothetical protein